MLLERVTSVSALSLIHIWALTSLQHLYLVLKAKTGVMAILKIPF